MTTAKKDYIALARQYEDDVLSGRIPACKWVRLALERNRRDLARAAAQDPTFPYDFRPDIAVRICRFAERLPHIKGPKAKIIGLDYDHLDEDGRPRSRWATIELEPHQCWFLTTLFGWVQRGTELRRFRIGLYLVPRKNAKSTLAAIIALLMVAAEGESGAECYSAATTRDQAKAIAEVAWEMAWRSPLYREYYGVRLGAKSTRHLEVPETASKFMPLSADAHSLDGLNIYFAAVDELHRHRTADVWNVIDTGTAARLQSLVLGTSTAGEDIGGICYQQLEYLRGVLQQLWDDERYFGIEYTIDEGDDWRLEATWRKANPNYGVSVQPDDIARKARQAERSPSAAANFATKHLNVWVRSASPWFPLREWQALADSGLKLEDLVDAPCWIGVDLAEVRDFASAVAVFRPTDDRYVFISRNYLPEAAVEASSVAALPGWVHEGHVIETPGNQADYLRIEDDLFAWVELLNVQEIDFDRALAAQMGQSLKKRLEPRMGRDAAEAFVVTVPQSLQVMNASMQKMESLVLAGQLAHDGNPAYTWMWSNVVADRNAKTDELYPRKAGGKDSPNKIDGAVASLTALYRAMLGVVKAAEPTYLYAVCGGKR